jgi:hypothetical protein
MAIYGAGREGERWAGTTTGGGIPWRGPSNEGGTKGEESKACSAPLGQASVLPVADLVGPVVKAKDSRDSPVHENKNWKPRKTKHLTLQVASQQLAEKERGERRQRMRPSQMVRELAAADWGETTEQANYNGAIKEDNGQLQYVEAAFIPTADNRGASSGTFSVYIDSGSAITLIRRDVYECLQLAGMVNHQARVIHGEGVWKDTKVLDTRVDFNLRVRAVDGTIVTIGVKARVAEDMDVPLLLGSSDLVANDMDLKLKQHLLSIGVYGGRRVDVRTCATQEESRRDSELEMSQIRHIKSLLEEGDNHPEESTLTPEEH